MKNELLDFLLCCESTDFGKPDLANEEKAFYRPFNEEILSLCRSLPDAARTDAMLFLMRYGGMQFGDRLDFFANYYAPSWSILYWLTHDSALPIERLNPQDLTNAVTAHSMAMLLHSMDDHLTDGQVTVSSLSLLLRSQAWMMMNDGFGSLSDGISGGGTIVRKFIDDYYQSTQHSGNVKSLEGYCDFFRKQMAIWIIAPILLCRKMTCSSAFTEDIEIAYGCFGVAWRLLDDVRDIADDIRRGVHSALYYCLPERLQTFWDSNRTGDLVTQSERTRAILDYMMRNRLLDAMKEKICAELRTAESIVKAHHLEKFAHEFRCLAKPLEGGVDTRDICHGRSEISRAAD